MELLVKQIEIEEPECREIEPKIEIKKYTKMYNFLNKLKLAFGFHKTSKKFDDIDEPQHLGYFEEFDEYEEDI